MRNPDYEIRKGRRIGSLDGNKRRVAQLEFGLSKTSDNSSGLGIMLHDKVDWASVTGAPVDLHFYLTNNSTNHITPTNGIVDLHLPIIPVIWDTDSDKDLEDFVKNGRDPSKNAKKFDEMDEKLARLRMEEYTAELENYVLFEFGLRYAKAMKNNDVSSAAIIKKLNMMKDFDFDLCTQIYNDQVQGISPTQLPFIKSFKQYLTTKNKFQKLSKTMEDFIYHDVDRAINGESFAEIYASQPE